MSQGGLSTQTSILRLSRPLQSMAGLPRTIPVRHRLLLAASQQHLWLSRIANTLSGPDSSMTITIRLCHYTEADADGDGVSDSIWVPVPDKMSAQRQTHLRRHSHNRQWRHAQCQHRPTNSTPPTLSAQLRSKSILWLFGGQKPSMPISLNAGQCRLTCFISLREIRLILPITKTMSSGNTDFQCRPLYAFRYLR